MLGVLVGACLGCSETPLDATFLQEASDPMDEPDPMEDELAIEFCPTSTPERDVSYYLLGKARMECLSAGTTTEIAMTPNAMGYTVVFEACQDLPAQHWQLLDGDELPFDDGTYQVRNVELDLNLDLEARQFDDGTELLLYDPHGMINQVFSFDLRGADDFRIETVQPASSCLEDMVMGDNAVELQGCTPSENQLWYLSPIDCGAL